MSGAANCGSFRCGDVFVREFPDFTINALRSHIWLKGKITAHFSIFNQKTLIKHAAVRLTKHPVLRIFCTERTETII